MLNRKWCAVFILMGGVIIGDLAANGSDSGEGSSSEDSAQSPRRKLSAGKKEMPVRDGAITSSDSSLATSVAGSLTSESSLGSTGKCEGLVEVEIGGGASAGSSAPNPSLVEDLGGEDPPMDDISEKVRKFKASNARTLKERQDALIALQPHLEAYLYPHCEKELALDFKREHWCEATWKGVYDLLRYLYSARMLEEVCILTDPRSQSKSQEGGGTASIT